jgi:NTP pyrophosphatase (non-canonical NTP hydrolase)
MLNRLGKEIIQINTANGFNVTTPADWDDPYKIPAVLMLVVTEVAEATEGFRHNDKENFAEECADVVIRMFDLTAGLGIDIEATIAAKLEKNKGRGFKHGGKRI